MSSRRNDLIALAVLAAVPLLKFLAVTLGVAVFSGGDHAWINLPLKEVTREAFAARAVPLWNNALSCGTPHLAQGEAGVFYPGNLLIYTPVDLLRAYGWTILAHVVALSWATYLLLRVYGCRVHVATVFAALLSVSPYVLFNLPTSNVVQTLWFVPAVLLVWEWGRRDSPWAAGTVAGAMVGVVLLIGRPAVVVYAGLTVGVIGAVQAAVSRRPAVHIGRLAAFGVLSVVVGAALAAVQLLPTLEFMALSSRGAGLQADFAEAGGWLGVTRLFSLILFPAFPVDPGRYAAYHASNPFMGAVPFVLMLVGMWRGLRHHRTAVLPLAAGVVFSLLLAMGPAIPVWRVLWSFPPLSALRYPGRAIPVFLCLAYLLAAKGWDSLTEERGRATSRELRWIAAALVVALASFVAQGGAVVAPQVALVQLGVQLLPLVVVAGWGRLRRRPLAWNLAIAAGCVVQAIPLFLFYGEFTQPRREFLATVRSLDAVGAAPQGERNVVVGGMQLVGDPGVNPPTLGNGAMLGGAAVVNEFNQFTWGEWRTFMRRTLHRQASGRVTPPPSESLSDLLGIRWLYLSKEPGWSDPGWQEVGEVGGDGAVGSMGLWRRRDGPGRATLVHDVVRRPQPDADELVRMVDDGHDFRGSVVISASRAPEPEQPEPGSAGRIEARDTGPNEILLEVDAPAAGYVVVRDHFAAGWEAELDGEGVPLYRANGFFKAVWVPRGRHDLHLIYRSTRFEVGSISSAITVLLLLVLLGARLVGRRARGHSTRTSNTPV